MAAPKCEGGRRVVAACGLEGMDMSVQVTLDAAYTNRKKNRLCVSLASTT